MTDYVTIYKKRTKWAWFTKEAGGQDGFDTAREALDHWINHTEDRAVPIYINKEEA